MFRVLPLLLLAACAVDNSTAEAVPTPSRTASTPPETVPAPEPAPAPTPLPVPKLPDPVPVPTPPMPAPAPTPGSLVLSPGEQAEFAPQSSLRYDKLLNDSRCPAAVQCVWAGEVRLALTLSIAGKDEAFELASTREKSKVVQGVEVTLLDYGPCPLGHGAPKLECATLSATTPKP